MAENSAENRGNPNPQPQFEIPKGLQEQKEGQEALSERAIEQRQVTENAPAKQAPKLPPTPSDSTPAGQITPAQPSSSQSSVSPVTADLSAQDADLIEKEWVERAKHIVTQTQDDPFKQKDEMSKIKADYIKKRFDKTIPVDDTKKS